MVDAAADVRAWIELDRAPRGLVSEPGAAPGRARICFSKAAASAVSFRVESDPVGALRLVARGEPVVEVAAGRDVVSFSVAGLVRGPARIVARPVGGAGAGREIAVAIDVASQDDLAEPVVDVRAEPPREGEAADALLAGSREIAGVRGGLAGRVVVQRSGFRAFATEATEVQVVAEDPLGILAPVPWSVTIPPGRNVAPEPLEVRLRDVEGEAKLRFRVGGRESVVAVRSASVRWVGPARIVVPAGARAAVALSLVPGAREMPQVSAATAATGLADVAATVPSRTIAAEHVDVAVTARSPGETTLRVTAEHRPDFTAALVVVPREVEVRAGRVVLTGLAAGARGDVWLSLVRAARPAGAAAGTPRPARFELDDGVGIPAGVGVERGGSSSSAVLHLAIDPGGPAEVLVPLRIEGDAEALRVGDASRGEPRAEYTIDARP